MLYHISHKNLGSRVTLVPRWQLDGGDTPAICVCPSILQCLVALPIFRLEENSLWVYSTSEKGANVKESKSVFDYFITKEKRFYRPTEFELDSVIKGELLYNTAGLLREYWDKEIHGELTRKQAVKEAYHRLKAEWPFVMAYV